MENQRFGKLVVMNDEMPLSDHSVTFKNALKKEFPEIWEYSNSCELLEVNR